MALRAGSKDSRRQFLEFVLSSSCRESHFLQSAVIENAFLLVFPMSMRRPESLRSLRVVPWVQLISGDSEFG